MLSGLERKPRWQREQDVLVLVCAQLTQEGVAYATNLTEKLEQIEAEIPDESRQAPTACCLRLATRKRTKT
jgi:hypothetical protein